MKKYYIWCDVCSNRRTKRTGQKKLLYKAPEGWKAYDREYKCDNCGNHFWFDEMRNLFH